MNSKEFIEKLNNDPITKIGSLAIAPTVGRLKDLFEEYTNNGEQFK